MTSLRKLGATEAEGRAVVGRMSSFAGIDRGIPRA